MRPSPAFRRPLTLLSCLAAAGGLGLAWCWWHALPPGLVPAYVGTRDCTACHASQAQAWTGSDHQLAMDVATPHTVLGDFRDREYTHFGVTSRFFRRGDAFCVTTDGPDGKQQTYTVKYVFGVHPLQQYLVEFPDGRVQCLPLAWDTKGKQWFHLYPHEPIPHSDVLHWTRPLQNWNYMCAECHTTNLQKNFHFASNTYHTTFTEINVACETCHGPGSLHVEQARSWRPFWDRRYGYALAKLKGPDSHVQIDSCAPCHARRRILYPGFRGGEKFLDYYFPELLDTELYWPDGQIRDEDYEYGSFLQSKMYSKGVRCSDCHDPHTMRVKFKSGPTITDNRLCGQCHLPSKYDTDAHHHHPVAAGPVEKSGTLCISCHMPTTTYMVVDPRLDHSIRIPRPELTVALGIPNACNGCHHDQAKGQTPQWAAKTVLDWYGAHPGPPHFAYAIAAGRQGKPEGAALLDAVARRKDLSAIVRASALLLLSRYGPQAAEATATNALDDPEDLVRAAAVRSLHDMLPDREWIALLAHSPEHIARLAPRLADPVRAVRIEAAQALSSLAPEQLPPRYADCLEPALAEYVRGQESLADQPGAHLCIGALAENRRRPQEALDEYHAALRLDPAFTPAHVNLARLQDTLGNKEEAEKEQREVIREQPQMADAYYSLGMLLGESPARMTEAAAAFEKAATLAPDRARIHYNHGIALQSLRQYGAAEQAYQRALKLAPGTLDFLNALLVLHLQQRHWDRAAEYLQELIRVDPNNPQWPAALAQLRTNPEALLRGN